LTRVVKAVEKSMTRMLMEGRGYLKKQWVSKRASEKSQRTVALVRGVSPRACGFG
jgi:hypothetical protein